MKWDHSKETLKDGGVLRRRDCQIKRLAKRAETKDNHGQSDVKMCEMVNKKRIRWRNFRVGHLELNQSVCPLCLINCLSGHIVAAIDLKKTNTPPQV